MRYLLVPTFVTLLAALATVATLHATQPEPPAVTDHIVIVLGIAECVIVAPGDSAGTTSVPCHVDLPFGAVAGGVVTVDTPCGQLRFATRLHGVVCYSGCSAPAAQADRCPYASLPTTGWTLVDKR